MTAKHDDYAQMREEDFRRMLGGRCVWIGDRWFGETSSPAERMAYLKSYNARQERNWRRRARRRCAALAAMEAARLARLPPWVQTGITGRTATQTMRSGIRVPVDYRETYGHAEFGPLWLEHDYLVSGLLLAVQDGARLIGNLLARRQDAAKRVPRLRQPLGEWDELMRTERRKICRRSTTAPCPTATDIRVAWHFAPVSPDRKLHLGRLLMDLECYVNNDLRIKWFGRHPKIVARQPGIRGWIREHCPELVPKYKTLMRYKSMATRIRQDAGGMDPLSPQSASAGSSPSRVHVQPRARGLPVPREQRFAWEFGEHRIDADGRPFLTNANYSRATLATDQPPRMERGPRAIVLNGRQPRAIENYIRAPVGPSSGASPTESSKQVDGTATIENYFISE